MGYGQGSSRSIHNSDGRTHSLSEERDRQGPVRTRRSPRRVPSYISQRPAARPRLPRRNRSSTRIVSVAQCRREIERGAADCRRRPGLRKAGSRPRHVARARDESNAAVSEEQRQKWFGQIEHGFFQHAVNNALLHVFAALGNNHFVQIGDYLDHPCLYGRYIDLMPHYLFALLFQKVSILRQLVSNGAGGLD